MAFGSNEARQWLTQESADHRAALAALEAGNFPDDVAGRRIAALAARSSATEAGLIRDYLTTGMKLTVAAEEKLLGQPIPPTPELKADLKRLEILKGKMGCAAWTALEPLLPFSRNDLWEVKELAEDLHREA